VDFSGEKSDEFIISFGRESARLAGSVHFRLEMDKSNAALAVFKGKVMVDGPFGNVEVGKKQTASFDFADNDRSTLAKNVEEAPFDQWDKRQDQYHDSYLARNNYGSPYAYGVSDLNYYGNFFSVPGYGMVWQPYFTGVGWDPFMNGAWCWYPGFGYMWVSSYPWGWMPYRYGSWLFASPYGWVWQPGGFGAGWNRVPRLVNAPSRFTMPQAPTGPGRTTLVVNRNSFVPNRGPSTNRMVIRNDSAGLGIPRGALRNPAKVSREVIRQGSVTTRIQAPAARATPTPVPTVGSQPASRPVPTASSPSSGGSGSRMGSAPRMPRSAPTPRSAPSPRSTPR
jgi:hypothetical protein